MSWTDKELADMAKTSQAEQKFAYNDSFFAEVEAMLPKKKKRVFPFFALPLIPMMGILAYIGMAEPVTPDGVAAAKTMEASTNYIAQSIERSNDISIETQVPTESSDVKAIETNVISNYTEIKNVSSNISEGKTPKDIKSTKVVTTLAKMVADIDDKTEIALNKIAAITSVISKEKEIRPFEAIEKTEIELTVPTKELIQSEKPRVLHRSVDRLTPLQLSSPLFATASAPATFGRMTPFAPRSKWNMYIEAGAGMGESYISSQVGHTQALNLGLGARYDFKTTFFQLGAAGEFQKVNMELSERAKIYHTSSTELENRMNYKQLYRIQMPLTFGYKLNKHSVQASLIPSYLVGAKMKYTYLENGQAMRNETMYNQRKGWNDFSTSVGFGYGYQVFKGFTLGANVNWQFMNQVNRNEVSEGNTKPMSGQVFIRKTLK